MVRAPLTRPRPLRRLPMDSFPFWRPSFLAWMGPKRLEVLRCDPFSIGYKICLELDQVVLPEVRCEPGATGVVRVGIQPGEFPAALFVADEGQALVASKSAGEADQDRCQGRSTWPLPHFPDGRGRHQQGFVRRSSVAGRSITFMPCVGKPCFCLGSMDKCLYALNITCLFATWNLGPARRSAESTWWVPFLRATVLGSALFTGGRDIR